MGGQVDAQLQGQGLHPFAPGCAQVREDVVVDLAQEPLDQGLDDGGLVREVRVHRVRSHADLRRDAADGRRVRPTVVEQGQRCVQDLVLGEGSAGSGTPPPDGFWCRADRLH
jgi:hypothetical protein